MAARCRRIGPLISQFHHRAPDSHSHWAMSQLLLGEEGRVGVAEGVLKPLAGLGRYGLAIDGEVQPRDHVGQPMVSSQSGATSTPLPRKKDGPFWISVLLAQGKLEASAED